MVHDHRVVGLVADRVRGVARVAGPRPRRAVDGLRRRCSSRTPSSTRTRRRPVSVLDAAALLGLPGVPTRAGAAGGRHVAATARARRSRREPDARALRRPGAGARGRRRSTPRSRSPRSAPSLLTGGDCLRRHVVRRPRGAGRRPDDAVGLPALDADEVRAGVVLDLGPGQVVLAVSDLVELRGGRRRRPARSPASPTTGPSWSAACSSSTTAPCLVLDGAGLRPTATCSPSPSVNTDLGSRRDAGDLAGSLAGTPRRAARRTSPTPRASASPRRWSRSWRSCRSPTRSRPSAVEQVVGVVVHRGRTVPVVPLATVLGHEPGRARTVVVPAARRGRRRAGRARRRLARRHRAGRVDRPGPPSTRPIRDLTPGRPRRAPGAARRRHPPRPGPRPPARGRRPRLAGPRRPSDPRPTLRLHRGLTTAERTGTP